MGSHLACGMRLIWSALPTWQRWKGRVAGILLGLTLVLLLPAAVHADDPIFTDSGQYLGFSRSSGVALGDLDSDGDLDAFVVNESDDPDIVWINQREQFAVRLPEGGGRFELLRDDADLVLRAEDGDELFRQPVIDPEIVAPAGMDPPRYRAHRDG